MYTRIVENQGSLYTGAEEVTLRRMNGKSIIFDAAGNDRIKQGFGSGEDMFNFSQGEERAKCKTLQLDIENDNIIRVRYCENIEVPENKTPMVINDFQEGFTYSFKEEADEYEIRTSTYRIVITKKPYSLSIFDINGIKKFGASQGECNNFKSLDAFNIGIVRWGDKLSKQYNPTPLQFEKVAYTPDAVVGVESFELRADEHIYGFGENFTGLDKKYQTIDLWTQDALGPVSQRTYKPVPFYVSSRGYGIYANSHSPMTFWVGSMSNIRTVMAVEDDFLDYYIILGKDMKQVIAGYTNITGRCSLPPKWSFGFWMSKFTYHSADETRGVVDEMRKRKLPFDVLHLDTHWFEEDWICDLEFGKSNFPNPKEYIKEMKEKGVHISLWQMPYIKERSRMFHEAMEKGYLPLKDGRPDYHDSKDGSKMAVLDVTNPGMIEWWKEKFRKLFEMGVSAIKTDFGEGALTDCIYHNGMAGRKLHNLYPLLYNKAIYEVTSEFTDQPMLWGRSAWAGSQRYPLYWGGDNSGYFEQVIPQLVGGLSLAMSGFPFWSQDIAGFASNVNDMELYVRWYQVGIFMSNPRMHGVGEREPYRFGPKVEDIIRNLLNLRYTLMPYIYSSAYESVNTSVPFIRPLTLEFEDDNNTNNICDQFMFGPYMMVAPIMEKGGRRRVYLPKGSWYDFHTGQKLEGERWMNIEAALEHIPLYVKAGAIIPMGPVMQYTNEKPCDPLTLKLYPDGESNFEYYDDNERFQIRLYNDKVEIDGCEGHNLNLNVYTRENVKSILVNGKPIGFELRDGYLYLEFSSDENPLLISWS